MLFLFISSLPYNPESVAIKMPTLHDPLLVLEYNLNECPIVSLQNRCIEVNSSTGWGVRYVSYSKASNLEVINKLERSISWHKGHTVDSISLLSIDLSSRVCKSDSSSCVDHTIMV